jgi:hypothetical protein
VVDEVSAAVLQEVNATANKIIMLQIRLIFLAVFFKILLKKIHLPPSMGREVMKTQ